MDLIWMYRFALESMELVWHAPYLPDLASSDNFCFQTYIHVIAVCGSISIIFKLYKHSAYNEHIITNAAEWCSV